MNISKSLRVLVWTTYIGEGEGSFICVCGSKITPLSFEVGHVQASSKKGTNDISNLRPICSICNKSMGTTNMRNFFHKLGKDVDAHYVKSEEIINIYTDEPMEEGEELTEYRQLQKKAKDIGIRANYSKDVLQDLLNKHEGGEKIDPAHLTVSARGKFVPVAAGGGGMLLGCIIGWIIGHYMG
jgi:hypothetical protein